MKETTKTTTYKYDEKGILKEKIETIVEKEYKDTYTPYAPSPSVPSYPWTNPIIYNTGKPTNDKYYTINCDCSGVDVKTFINDLEKCISKVI